jgi:hypothetical protein
VRQLSAREQAARHAAELLQLDLPTRVEQRCNAQAGDVISQEHPGFQVDRVIAYAFGEAEVNGTELVAPGAIARSKGKWYRVTFRCRTSPDGLEVEDFDHELGAEVPGWDQGDLEH